MQTLVTLRKEKKELDEKIDRLEQDAYIAMVRREQDLEHEKRLKQLRERQTLQRRAQRRKKFIDSAFDGNLEELKVFINEFQRELDTSSTDGDEGEKYDEATKKKALHGLIDCRDSNENSALSEAAAGKQTLYY